MERLFFLFLYIIELLFVLTIQTRYYHSFRNPITFFSLVWIVVGFCSNTPIMDFYYPSDLVNVCIVMGIFVFTLVFVVSTKPKVFSHARNEGRGEKFNFTEGIKVRYRLICFLLIIGYLFLIPKILSSIRLIGMYGLAFIRDNLDNVEAGLSYGSSLDTVYTYFIEPMFTAISIFSCVLLYSKEPKKKVFTLFIASFLSLCGCSIAEASRGGFVKFIFCLCFATMICNKKIIMTILRYKFVRYGLIGMAAVIVIVSLGRANADSVSDFKYLETFYIYYFSGPSYMTQLLAEQPLYATGGIILFGQATFGFLTNFISFAKTFFFGTHTGSMHILGSVLTNVGYKISPYRRVNAMCTCFYNFLLDWSYLGIIVGPCVLALASAAITKQNYKKRTYFTCSLYVLWLYVLTRTVFKLETSSIYFASTIIYMMLFSKKKVIKSF